MATKTDRIATDLRKKIQTGALQPGTQLAVEGVLTDAYRVSLVTVRRALDLLAAEGLIEKRQGIGTFVRAPRQKIRRSSDRYQWEHDRVRLSEEERRASGAVEQDTGLDLDDLDFHAEYRTIGADEDLAEAFGVPVGTTLLERVYRTSSREDRAPFGIGRSLLVYDMIKDNPALLDPANEPWPGGTHHQLSTVGIEIDRIVDDVTARPPLGDEADELSITAGVAVLVLRKTSIDTRDKVVEIVEAVYPGDRTELSYTIRLKHWDE